MNRRTFVKTSTLATAALATSQAFGFKGSPRKIGIQLYSVRDEVAKGIEPVFAKLASFGYEQIEMYGYEKGLYFGKDMKAIATMLKQHNLTSPSAHLGLGGFLHRGDDDELKKAIDDARVIGNRYLVVPSLDGNYRKTADDYKKIAARLNVAGERCKGSGLQFAYHNHAFEFDSMGAQTGYDILLQETDPKLVKMELDLFWVKNAGHDPLALFAKYPGRFTMWHVKDMDKQDKNKQTEVGNGCIDFKEIFKAQKQSGLEYFFVEQENYDISPYDSIEKCFKYVKANLV